jgi:transglutaminase-like putative cysteine protease
LAGSTLKSWQLLHESSYTFSQPVALGPHRLYLVADCGQLRAWPQPSLSYFSEDEWNNRYLQIWYDRPVSHLRLINQIRYQPHPFNPFEFVLEPERGCAVAADYLRLEPLPADWLAAFSGDAVSLAVQINSWIHQNIRYQARHEAGLQSPSETLRQGQGCCRDLAHLWIVAMRHLGHPARAVSGYWFQLESAQTELHAWAEVFWPGAGWRAFDPTAGLAVSGHHLALAKGPDLNLLAPVQGTHSPAEVDVTFRLRLRAAKRL